jgi:hypothetical protein
MPTYYVSKCLPLEGTSVYVQDEDSWTAVLPEGETSAFRGTIPADVLDRICEIGAGDARQLIEKRRTDAARRLEVQRLESRRRFWRSIRIKILVALGVLVLIGAAILVGVWKVHVDNPAHRYQHVQIGMTYPEVVHIMGTLGGGEDKRDTIPDGEYVWGRGHNEIIGIYITFENGIVVSKDIQSLAK